MIHEMSHLLRDRLGTVEMNISAASQIVLEETLGTIAAGYYQRSFLSPEERVDSGNKDFAKVREEELKFYDRRGVFRSVYDQLAENKNLYLFEFLEMTFLRKGFASFLSDEIERQIYKIYNTISKGYLGRKINQSQKEELDPGNWPLELSQLGKLLKTQRISIVEKDTVTYKDSPKFYVNNGRGEKTINLFEVLEELQKIHEALSGSPSRNCLSFQEKLKNEEASGFIGKCHRKSYGGEGIVPGGEGIVPGGEAIVPGGEAITPLLKVDHFCRAVKL